METLTSGNKITTPAGTGNWTVRMFGTHFYYQGETEETSKPVWTQDKAEAHLFTLHEAETMVAGFKQGGVIAVAVSRGGSTIGGEGA